MGSWCSSNGHDRGFGYTMSNILWSRTNLWHNFGPKNWAPKFQQKYLALGEISSMGFIQGTVTLLWLSLALLLRQKNNGLQFLKKHAFWMYLDACHWWLYLNTNRYGAYMLCFVLMPLFTLIHMLFTRGDNVIIPTVRKVGLTSKSELADHPKYSFCALTSGT